MATESSRDAFAKAILALAEAYGITLTEVRVKVYRRALADLSTQQILHACGSALKECQFFPTVAQLRQHAGASGDDVGLLAWAQLSDLASGTGAYGAVVLDEATAQALLDVFGSWPEYCEMEDGPQMAIKRQEFLAAHRRARREVRGQNMRELPGWVETGPRQLPEKAES